MKAQEIIDMASKSAFISVDGRMLRVSTCFDYGEDEESCICCVDENSGYNEVELYIEDLTEKELKFFEIKEIK